eukprot:COSAG06_NODE_31489_length_520_cov_4.560570_1_plen_58_part_00
MVLADELERKAAEYPVDVESGGWRPTATAAATNEDGEGGHPVGGSSSGACSGQYQLV